MSETNQTVLLKNQSLTLTRQTLLLKNHALPFASFAVCVKRGRANVLRRAGKKKSSLCLRVRGKGRVDAVWARKARLLDDAKFAPYLDEGSNGRVEVFATVCGRELNADARLVFGHNGIEEARHVYAFFLHLGCKAL